MALIDNVVTTIDGHTFSPKTFENYKESTFHHLSCFAGGMFSFGSKVTASNDKFEFDIGEKITKTCMDFYSISKSGLGGEIAKVDGSKLTISNQSYYLRPEVIESIFYLWRLTKDSKYREFGKIMVKNLELKCRDQSGYHTLDSLGNPGDKMESFFIAETLKYLFLLFSDDSVIPRNFTYLCS